MRAFRDHIEHRPGGRGIARLLLDIDGAVAVEIALLTPVLCFMIIASIDFGMAVDENMRLHAAARAGAQFAVQTETNIDDTAGMQNAVNAATNLRATGNDLAISAASYYACANTLSTHIAFSNVTGAICAGNTAYPGYYVTVTLVEKHTTLFSWPGIDNPMVLTGSATMRLY